MGNVPSDVLTRVLTLYTTFSDAVSATSVSTELRRLFTDDVLLVLATQSNRRRLVDALLRERLRLSIPPDLFFHAVQRGFDAVAVTMLLLRSDTRIAVDVLDLAVRQGCKGVVGVILTRTDLSCSQAALDESMQSGHEHVVAAVLRARPESNVSPEVLESGVAAGQRCVVTVFSKRPLIPIPADALNAAVMVNNAVFVVERLLQLRANVTVRQRTLDHAALAGRADMVRVILRERWDMNVSILDDVAIRGHSRVLRVVAIYRGDPNLSIDILPVVLQRHMYSVLRYFDIPQRLLDDAMLSNNYKTVRSLLKYVSRLRVTQLVLDHTAILGLDAVIRVVLRYRPDVTISPGAVIEAAAHGHSHTLSTLREMRPKRKGYREKTHAKSATTST